MELINKKKSKTIVLDEDSKIFVVHVATLDIKRISTAIYPSWAAYIQL